MVIVVFCGLVGLPAFLSVQTARADDGASIEECLSCHDVELARHDALGSLNEACWSCHDKSDMTMLHLANGELLPLSESSTLCGQCHQDRYDLWQEGTHGLSGTVAVVPCANCHDPHSPAVVLTDITKQHTTPTPPPPSPPPSDVLIIVGISLAILIVLVITVSRRGRVT